LLKEWAYAGVTFALVMATISAYLTGERLQWLLPPLILTLVAIPYFTRPPSRRVSLLGSSSHLAVPPNAPSR
jgi:hypothetical protein